MFSLSYISLVFNSFFLFSLFLGYTRGQLPIPSHPDGFTYKNGSFSAPIQIDFHVDLLCPDCKASFPTMLQVAERYGDDTLRLNTHSFPLPYHRNAYLAATGSQAVVNENEDDMVFYTWAQGMFDNQEKFLNDATEDMTVDEIISMYGDVAEDSGLKKKVITTGLKSKEVDGQTRVSWKYGCSRGVASTPTFFINGVTVNASPSWTVKDWSQLIDSILSPSSQRKGRQNEKLEYEYGIEKRNNDCPAGQVYCEYLPDQVECCTSGESCIPNVGCRC